jgi:hypothetical protein
MGLLQAVADDKKQDKGIEALVAGLQPYLFFLDPDAVADKITQIDAETTYSLEYLANMGIITQDMLDSGELIQNKNNQFLGMQVIMYFLNHYSAMPSSDNFLNGVSRKTLANFFSVSLFQLNQAIAALEEIVIDEQEKLQKQPFALQYKPVLVSGAVHREYILRLYSVLKEEIKQTANAEEKEEEEKPAVLYNADRTTAQTPSSILKIAEAEQTKIKGQLSQQERKERAALIEEWIRNNKEQYEASRQTAKGYVDHRRAMIHALSIPTREESNRPIAESRRVEKLRDESFSDTKQQDIYEQQDKDDKETTGNYQKEKMIKKRLLLQLPQPRHWILKWADPDDKFDNTRENNAFINELIACGEIEYTPLDFQYVIAKIKQNYVYKVEGYKA